MLDIGIQELLVVMVLALLIFGPDKLPDLGRRLGRAMREFRRASDEFRSTVEQNLQINVDHDISSPRRAGRADAGERHGAGSSGGHAGRGRRSGTGSPAVEPAGAERRTARDRRLTTRSSRTGRAGEGGSSTAASAPGGPGSPAGRIPLKTAPDGWEQGLKAVPGVRPEGGRGRLLTLSFFG